MLNRKSMLKPNNKFNVYPNVIIAKGKYRPDM